MNDKCRVSLQHVIDLCIFWLQYSDRAVSHQRLSAYWVAVLGGFFVC